MISLTSIGNENMAICQRGKKPCWNAVMRALGQATYVIIAILRSKEALMEYVISRERRADNEELAVLSIDKEACSECRSS